MSIEYKSLNFELKKVSDNEDNFTFTGYASTFGNVDLVGDIIEEGAFDRLIRAQKPLKILWQHEMTMPIGLSSSFRVDEKGLFIEAKLPKSDTFVSGRVIPQINVGSIREMSIGFYVIDEAYTKTARILKDIDVVEVSLVTRPANPEAQVTNFKSVSANVKLPLADKETEWDSSAAIKRLKDKIGAVEAPNSDYKKYFLYYDSENQDVFGSYKLPFVDVIDDTIKIVPKAVFAIAGALSGARGGVDIPAADKKKATQIVNSLYKRMSEEFSDEELVSPLKAKNLDLLLDLKDVEVYLKDLGLSNKEAKTLISKAKEFSNTTQRDAEPDAKRDAELYEQLSSKLNEIKSIFNKKTNFYV